MKIILKLIHPLLKVTFGIALLFVSFVPVTYAAALQATLSDPSGASSLAGQINLADTSAGLDITVAVENAPPGYHGIHVHEGSSCADNGNAAGGHYNPDGVKHGYLLQDGFDQAHAGDLGNILIYSDGTGTYQATVPGLSLEGGDYVVANRTLIIHGDRDDFGQPTGNAGSRIGCSLLSAG